MDEIEKQWNDFYSTPFPPLHGELEVAGISLPLIDTYAAGCIDTFLGNAGKLDRRRLLILQECVDDLAIILPELDGEAWDYFAQLQKLVTAVMNHLSKQPAM
jgi:hypothetical protein